MKTKWQILAIITLAISFAWYYNSEIIRNDAGESIATDFASYYYAGRLAQGGQDFYDFSKMEALNDSGLRIYPYIYPPPIADFFAFVSAESPEQAKQVWSLLLCACLAFISIYYLQSATSIGALGAGAKKALGWASICVLIFALGSVLRMKDNLWLGQVNIFVLVFICIAIVSSRRKAFIVSACAIAIATMLKITPIFLLPFLAPRRKEDLWRYILGFVLTSLAIFGITSTAYGFDQWLNFVGASSAWGYGATVGGLFPPSVSFNNSFAGLFTKLFGDGSVIAKFLSWAALLVFLGYLYIKQHKNGVDSILLPLLIVMVIASPMAYRHHYIFLLPGVLSFADTLLLSTKYSNWQRVGIASLLGASLYFAGFPWDLFAAGGAWGLVCNSAGTGFLLLAFCISVKVSETAKQT